MLWPSILRRVVIVVVLVAVVFVVTAPARAVTMLDGSGARVDYTPADFDDLGSVRGS